MGAGLLVLLGWRVLSNDRFDFRCRLKRLVRLGNNFAPDGWMRASC